MNTIKKLAVILITILLTSSGLLFGCQSLYSKMELELSVEEITLYINSDTQTPEVPEVLAPEVPEVPGEEVPDEEEILGDNMANFTATISNLPKNVSNNIIISQTVLGIVKVEFKEKDNETNKTTFKLTALKPGLTTLIVTTEEGNKQVELPITVIEEIESLSVNTSYNPMVVAGEEGSINTAQALKFFAYNDKSKRHCLFISRRS